MREPWYAAHERAADRKRHLHAVPAGELPDYTPNPPAAMPGAPWVPYYHPAPEPPLWRAALEALGEIVTAIVRKNP